TPTSVVANWKTQTGKDWDATGAYIALFYDQAVPDPTNLRFDLDTKPVAGVRVTDTGTPITTGSFFDPNGATMSATLMATGPFGGAAVPPTGNITTYSGTGGTCADGKGGMGACKWDVHPGASIPHG